MRMSGVSRAYLTIADDAGAIDKLDRMIYGGFSLASLRVWLGALPV